ncbi:MAG TPA: YARHG domain-containing protein [Niastella sp.]
MYETDISVKKEILTINRISSGKAAITVYYEFFNPKSNKELEVGFEATSPQGDVSMRPVNGQHPYITRFTVNMNGESIPFKVSIVSDSLYYNKGKFKSKTLVQANKESTENDVVDFFYVYHFKALFKPGINIVIHTYIVDLSSSVYENYALEYILTAAGRWANRQIDDFTLQINMGECQDLSIQNTFFSNASEWQIPETTKSIAIKKKNKNETDKSEFLIRKGILVFQKQNFKPIGQLYIHSFNFYFYNGPEDINTYDGLFNYKREGLPFSIEDQDGIKKPANELSKKILKNLPFARRGYIFKSPELQAYFEKQPWYKKDEKYEPVLAGLTQKEQAWLNKL